MTNETKHTATPWVIETALQPSGAPILFAPDAGHVICSFHYEVGQKDYSAFTNFEANAAHIVKCVNAHDDLVNALDRARYELVTEKYYPIRSPVVQTIDAALKKASAE